MKQTKPTPAPETLIEYARKMLQVARDHNARSLVAEIYDENQQRIAVSVERIYEEVEVPLVPDTQAKAAMKSKRELKLVDEQVDVKVGPKTSPRSKLTVPAALLDAKS